MKRITVAVCIDDEGGMTFNKRRQSRDRVLIRELYDTVKTKIHIQPYSEKLFTSYDGIEVSDTPFCTVDDGECVFIEFPPILPHIDLIDKIIVYKWNRLYPADTYFDIDLEKMGFALCESYEFEGSSHERITKGIYIKK